MFSKEELSLEHAVETYLLKSAGCVASSLKAGSTGSGSSKYVRAWATVEMLHKWKKVLFLSGKYRNCWILVFGGNDPKAVAEKAFKYLES